jgi:hypothetical protein
MGVRPTFLVIGAMKCGTTSLFDLLAQHPQIGMSTVKEPAFFCDDEIFARGLSWYESLFAHAAGRREVGEASTSYTKKFTYPRAAERIARHLPDAKLIYVVRHPLERIESQWMHGIHTGWHPDDFSRALDDPSLIDPSRYWRQINTYRDYFPDVRILVLFFDDFKADPLAVMSRCCDFLGVARSFVPGDPDQARNASASLESETPLLKSLRRVPLSRPIARVFPEGWRASLKRQFFTRRGGSRPTWPAEKRRRVVWEVGDDVRTFLEFYGRPADLWNLED